MSFRRRPESILSAFPTLSDCVFDLRLDPGLRRGDPVHGVGLVLT